MGLQGKDEDEWGGESEGKREEEVKVASFFLPSSILGP